MLAIASGAAAKHLPREKLGSELAAFGTQLGTELDDVERIMAVLPGVITRLRALSPLYKAKTPA